MRRQPVGRPHGVRAALATCVILLLAACGTVRPPPAAAPDAAVQPTPGAAPPAASRPSASVPKLPPAGSGRGGYYLDDGPGDAPPPNLEAVPDAIPKIEPYSLRGNKPYVVFGKTYTPITDNQPFKQRGVGSWYGKKFHGQKTSSGERYDMYKMSAAHPTLPIPSYARVTNLKNGAQVIVRVNDRGPFHSSRIIDLSYTAALRLGYIGHGSSELEVERLLPEEIARINAQARNPAPMAAAAAAVAAAAPPTLPSAPPVSAPGQAPNVSLDEFLARQPGDPAAPADSMAPVVAVNTVAQASSAIAPVAASSLAAATDARTDEPAAASGSPIESVAAELAPGIYLQFGAYARSGNADALRAQLLPRWPASLPLPEVRQSRALFRLFSGPYANREAAAAAARQVGANPQAHPLIVTR